MNDSHYANACYYIEINLFIDIKSSICEFIVEMLASAITF